MSQKVIWKGLSQAKEGGSAKFPRERSFAYFGNRKVTTGRRLGDKVQSGG